MEVAIDDAGPKKDLMVKVPTPAAYIFHKGLIFTRRKDRGKRAKDFYYIFDSLFYYNLLNTPSACGGVLHLAKHFP